MRLHIDTVFLIISRSAKAVTAPGPRRWWPQKQAPSSGTATHSSLGERMKCRRSLTTSRPTPVQTLAVAAAMAVVLVGCAPNETPGAREAPGAIARTGSPNPSPATTKGAELAEAKKRFAEYILVVDQLFADPYSSQRGLSEVAVERAPQILEATMDVHRELGVEFKGGTTIHWIDLRKEKLSKSPPTIDLRICLDPGTEVRFGKRLAAPADAIGPSLMDVRMKRLQHRWMVSDYFIGKTGLRTCSA
jgi:hypothetical protein